MTWGVTVDVAAPVEMYDAVHAALLERTGGSVEGLLVHIARETGDGFQVTEVWESQAEYDRYAADVVAPVLAELSGGRASPGDQTERPFEVRGLVLPRAGIAV
jgi:hypothetical protein